MTSKLYLYDRAVFEQNERHGYDTSPRTPFPIRFIGDLLSIPFSLIGGVVSVPGSIASLVKREQAYAAKVRLEQEQKQALLEQRKQALLKQACLLHYEEASVCSAGEA